MTSDLNAVLALIDEHRACLDGLGDTLDMLENDPTATQADRDKLIEQRANLRGEIADLYTAIDDAIRTNGKQPPEQWLTAFAAAVETTQSAPAREWKPSDVALWRGRKVAVLTPQGAQTILLPNGEEVSVFPGELQELPGRATAQDSR